jgi:hypothetical protein
MYSGIPLDGREPYGAAMCAGIIVKRSDVEECQPSAPFNPAPLYMSVRLKEAYSTPANEPPGSVNPLAVK